MKFMEGKGFRRLIVWQKAHELVLIIYRYTRSFPKDEIFGITSQIRRAVVSVAANIVEGQARFSKKELTQFLAIANASLVEVEYYIYLSRDLDYINEDQQNLLDEKRLEVGRLLHAFIQSVRKQ
jgi:four helix bundle protein